MFKFLRELFGSKAQPVLRKTCNDCRSSYNKRPPADSGPLGCHNKPGKLIRREAFICELFAEPVGKEYPCV